MKIKISMICMISMILLIGCVSAEETVDIKAHLEIDCYYCLSNWHVFLMDELVEHVVPPGPGLDPYDFPMPTLPGETEHSEVTSSMPGMSGLDVFRRLKRSEVYCGLPVVLFTALGVDVGMMLGDEYKVDGYLRKPFTRDQLLEKIEKYMRKR